MKRKRDLNRLLYAISGRKFWRAWECGEPLHRLERETRFVQEAKADLAFTVPVVKWLTRRGGGQVPPQQAGIYAPYRRGRGGLA